MKFGTIKGVVSQANRAAFKNAIMYVIAFAWLVRNHVIIVHLILSSLFDPHE